MKKFEPCNIHLFGIILFNSIFIPKLRKVAYKILCLLVKGKVGKLLQNAFVELSPSL